MERMSPRRLERMLSDHPNQSITGIVHATPLHGDLPDGMTSLCVGMVAIVYEGPVWWHVEAGEIPAELSNDCVGIQGVHSEIKRVLMILAPKLHPSTVNRLRDSGWLHTIG